MRYVVGIDEVGRAARRRASPNTYVIGIDEVGRGPLAGPVVVCAVALPAKLAKQGAMTRHSAMLSHSATMRSHSSGKTLILRDSKRLTERQREAWFAHFKTVPGLRYALARVYPREIERLNISLAANLAAFRALQRLAAICNLQPATSRIFLDGGLFIKNKKHSTALGAKTVIKGDEKIPAVSIASIIAKVTRDRQMKRLAQKYPKYGFETHKGYGTRAHFAAIRRLGTSPVHRRTFLS